MEIAVIGHFITDKVAKANNERVLRLVRSIDIQRHVGTSP